jgi:hypothetical protein
MIARLWHGITPASKPDEHADYLNKHTSRTIEPQKEILAYIFCGASKENELIS